MAEGDFLRKNGEIIQGFPLVSGQVNIAAADGEKKTRCFCCSIDGNFTVTFADAVVATIPMVAGDVFTIPGGATVLAVAGAKFHYV